MNHCGWKLRLAPEIVVKPLNIKYQENMFSALWDAYIDQGHWIAVAENWNCRTRFSESLQCLILEICQWFSCRFWVTV